MICLVDMEEIKRIEDKFNITKNYKSWFWINVSLRIVITIINALNAVDNAGWIDYISIKSNITLPIQTNMLPNI